MSGRLTQTKKPEATTYIGLLLGSAKDSDFGVGISLDLAEDENPVMTVLPVEVEGGSGNR